MMTLEDKEIVDFQPQKWPDFFIVGAPKCGTTSLFEYLSQHADVHFPAFKELHYFGSDLIWRTRVVTREQALKEYRCAPAGKKCGEASVFYLYSAKAAQEIHAHNPDARIIIMIRNPLSMIPSLFHQSIRTGDETRLTLTEAMNVEAVRRQGQIDMAATNPGVMQQLYYSDVARYSEQIARYIKVFGAESICVIDYADFAKDPRAIVTKVALFLGLPPFEPTFERHNKGLVVRNNGLWRFIKHPNAKLRSLWRALLPARFRKYSLLIADRVVFKSRVSCGTTQDERLRLATLYAKDVEKIEALTNLDLSHWHTDFHAVMSRGAGAQDMRQ